MTDKKELQEEELFDVNGGIPLKRPEDMSPDALFLGGSVDISNSLCSNYQKGSTFTTNNRACASCIYLYMTYEYDKFYCENSNEDFHIIKSKGYGQGQNGLD